MNQNPKDFDSLVEAVLDLVLQNPGGTTPSIAKTWLETKGFFGKHSTQTHDADYARVSRAFKSLTEQGLITKHGKIYLANREQLQAHLEAQAILAMQKLAKLNPGDLDVNPDLKAALFGKQEGRSVSATQKAVKPSLLSKLFKTPSR
jgi:hypothetical protein